MQTVIGLDIGTTSAKAVAFNLEGKPLAEYGREYPILTPKPSWAEQDCETIFAAAVEALGKVTEKLGSGEIIAVGISSAMHSLIAVDANGRPLTHAVIWADNRSREQAERLRKGAGKEIYLRTGTPIHPMSRCANSFGLRKTRRRQCGGRINGFQSRNIFCIGSLANT